MTSNTLNANSYIASLVKQGICRDEIEAEKKLASFLAERELDRNLEEAREDIQNGRYIEATEENNKAFLKKLENQILAN